MNRIKLWMPFLYFKLIEKIDKIPVFVRLLNKFLDRIGIIRYEAWVNVKCVCCGGIISSSRNHLNYRWLCITNEPSEKCKYFGETKTECDNNPDCALRTDAKIIENRKYFYKIIRSEVLDVFKRYGVCIIAKDDEEVRNSLEEIWGDFIIYAFSGKACRYYACKQEEETIYKIKEASAIFLILYPNISYQRLEFKIKVLNTDDVETLNLLRRYLLQCGLLQCQQKWGVK